MAEGDGIGFVCELLLQLQKFLKLLPELKQRFSDRGKPEGEKQTELNNI